MMRSRVSARPSLCLLGVNADARLDGAYHSVMWVLQIGLFGIGVLGLPFSKIVFSPTGLRPWGF